MLADGIDLPVVLAVGLVVVVPLLVFQMLVESYLLGRIWKRPARELRGEALRANINSLMAGIPTKFANAFLYAAILPMNIPEYFARYPIAVGAGTLIYFAVTVAVEAVTWRQWARKQSISLHGGLWKGVLWANVATYIVMAPLHYFVTRPTTDVREYTSNTRWAKYPNTRVLFLDPSSAHLKTKLLGSDTVETVVAQAMRDYIVSSNLNVCLYRATNGSLCLWRKDPFRSDVVWRTTERYFIDQVAFSPSGDRVAILYDGGASLEILNVVTGKRIARDVQLAGLTSVAWTLNEGQLLIGVGGTPVRSVTVRDRDLEVSPIENFRGVELLPCYSLTGRGRWHGGGEWGASLRDDVCNDIHAWVNRGLSSNVRITLDRGKGQRESLVEVAANPGWLHLGGIGFSEVTFLDDCAECLIAAGNYVYLLDINQKRLGTVAEGKQFMAMTPRFLKTLQERK